MAAASAGAGDRWGGSREGEEESCPSGVLEDVVGSGVVEEVVSKLCARESDYKAYEAWYASEKETMFRAVGDDVVDGMLEVPVPEMSLETIYDDEPKTEKEVEVHKECSEIRKAACKDD